MSTAGNVRNTSINENRMESRSDSSSDEEGYLSPYCCSSDEEADQCHRKILDEMPAFSTQSLSPSGRSLSPIDLDTSPPRSRHSTPCSTPYDSPAQQQQQPQLGDDFVLLSVVNARIGLTPPPDVRSRNLETIFEDRFLETPPSREFESRTNQNLLRRSFRNRGSAMTVASWSINTTSAGTGTEKGQSITTAGGTNNKQFDGKRRLSLE